MAPQGPQTSQTAEAHPSRAQTSPETPTFRFGGKEVTFTHLDRVYYP